MIQITLKLDKLSPVFRTRNTIVAYHSPSLGLRHTAQYHGSSIT
jgi:hypothetical protein